jgi:heme-degrading monooxygenase HmoA
MYFISVTRLRVRSILFLPQFFWANEASVKAIKKIPGFIEGKELIDKGFTFWTVTIWQSPEAMKQFRNNDPHKSVMRKLSNWCDEAAYAHWTQETADFPDWDTIYSRLRNKGKLTKVLHPSPQQTGMTYPAPARTNFARPIKPAAN